MGKYKPLDQQPDKKRPYGGYGRTPTNSSKRRLKESSRLTDREKTKDGTHTTSTEREGGRERKR